MTGNTMLKNPHYQVVKIETDDDSFTQAVKDIILNTVVYDSHDRISATDILQALEDMKVSTL